VVESLNLFTPEESVPYFGTLLVILFILISNYLKGFRSLWSPLSIIAIIYAYYCVLGPYQAILANETTDRYINMRPHYASAFWGAFVSLLSFIAGFHFTNHKLGQIPHPINTNDLLKQYGIKVFIAGFILFTVSVGGNVAKLINPLDAEAVPSSGGSLANYFGLSLNFVIPGITFLFIYYLRTKKRLILFLVPFLLSLGLFITLGFRYRIVLLIGALSIAYFLTVRKRPNLIVAFGFPLLLIVIMGVLNVGRDYGRGLDVTKLEGESTESYYNSGLREAMIFQTSGAIIDMVPERYPHAGFTPIISTLVFPIPSAIYKGKNSGDYLFDTLDALYGVKNSKGAAMMSFAEYYLAFGWLGIIGGCFLLGWIYKRLWKWYLVNQFNPIVIVAYAVTVSYLYVIISRGYLPQVTMLFFFTVFPVFGVIWLVKRRYRRRILQTKPYPHAIPPGPHRQQP
jgi:oligosaccharide repeat unit polymerase